jgi:protein-L-isoaspartate(D-aspartate) O-methyltransferase
MLVEARREAMVDSQLRTTGVNDPAVLAAFQRVDRAQFVPQAAASLAYADTAVTIAPGRALLEPMTLGLLLTHAAAAAGARVLVVGAGTGYSAAVLDALGADVTAVEADPALAAAARANLAGSRVAVVEGELAAGWPAAAPYDLILIDGAAAVLPPALLAQVADGGRLAGVIVGADGIGRATAGRVAGGHFAGTGFAETGARVLPGFARTAAFVF